MAVRGQKAKNVGVKKTAPKPKEKLTPMKFYTPGAQASVAEANVKNPKAIPGAKTILANYKTNRTGSISPRKITRLKQIRANEASKARIDYYKQGASTRTKSGKTRNKISEAAAKMKKVQASASALVSTGERATAGTFGHYRRVAAAPASMNKNVRDYRKDVNTIGAREAQNKSVFNSRQKAARKSEIAKIKVNNRARRRTK